MENITKYYIRIREKIIEIYETQISRFIRQLFSKKVEVLFLGIDNAGKTTLVQKLKNDSTSTFDPTRHPVRNDVTIGNLKASVVDLGGHTTARLIWKNYYYDCDGIIFIIDAKDKKRFQIVKEAFEDIKNLCLEKNIPIAILVNKIDLLDHTPETAASDAIFVHDLKNSTGILENEKIKIFYVSIAPRNPEIYKNDESLIKAFTWLENKIFEKK